MATSAITGENFYSGTWEQISNILRVLNIGEGKLARITQVLINEYQETVDREIDGILSQLYQTPIKEFNQMQADGVTRRVFPGDIRRHARYMVAGRILLSEFTQLAQNITEQAQGYVDDATRALYAIIRFNHRIPGQVRKSTGFSVTMPPSLQPAAVPELNV